MGKKRSLTLAELNLAGFFADFKVRFDERLGERSNDCIAVTPQSSHTGGSPMSQRECAGFNWPPLPVSTRNPFGISPEASHACLPSSAFTGAVPSLAPSL